MKRIKQLEQILPVYKIEQNCILSKQGDVTLAFEVSLPEIFTLSTSDFEALHQAWVKAVKLLPQHTVVHKQDWFVEAKYRADFRKEDQSFLSRSSELHFNERPYLDHCCYLFLTKKPGGRKSSNALLSNLIRSSIVPAEVTDTKTIELFFEKASQFVRILEDSGYMKLRRLQEDEIGSTADKAGLLERYCYLLHQDEPPVIRDFKIGDELQIGDLHCQLFSLADVEDLPALCGPRVSYEKYSTDKTKFSVGFAAPVGQLLDCNHIYNQFIVVDDAQATMKKMESKRLRLQSLSAYSRENTISRDATNQFLNEAISQGRLPVKAHFNLLTWTADKAAVKDVKNKVSAALAQMDAKAKQETASAAQVYWASMPGNAADLPSHELIDIFAEQATCFFNVETAYQNSSSPVGIRLADRINGIPLHVDISDEPMARGICTNRSKFILGPSGSGKSFFTNLLLRSYVEQGSHAVVVDVGHSYRGLCELLGGYYFTYSEKEPICFNPFFLGEEPLDTEKKESIKTLLLALWKKDDESFTRSEYVSLSNALQAYFDHVKQHSDIFPCFNSFYEFLKDVF
ncbi:MAG: TraG family conjugative transposon ATPase, partial [Chitinophagaceae bacterium]